MESNDIVIILLTTVFLLLLMTFSMLFFFRFARKKIIEKEYEKTKLKLGNIEKIIHATIETQEVERNRIAKDLHDAISAKLNVVSLHLNMLLDDSLNVIEQKGSLNKILGITKNVLMSSRTIAHNLLPPILSKFGLNAAITELLNEFESTKTIRIDKFVNYNKGLSKMNELHLFRIIQELMNNSIKHGNAKNISVNLTDNANELSLIFIDDGSGFNVEEALLKKGLGLNNIKSRVTILKGELIIKSSLKIGAKFTITINKT